MSRLVSCVDFGSTYTKAALVDVTGGGLVATVARPTTTDTDVLDGWFACRAELARAEPAATRSEVVACSSAGGGLRIAVVGNEELITAEAGRRVALSSGGRVVEVVAGGLTDGGYDVVRAARPDVVLLVGGTDGGNAEAVVAAAATLADRAWDGPVVVAGNTSAQPEVEALLSTAGIPHLVTGNVVPRIGVLRPEGARAAIRAMFVSHVIGGKHLSRSSEFAAMVQGATPEAVLTAVRLLATQLGDLAVVDVGGATTDVHSVVEADPEDAGREVVAALPANRTVEGDLGMRRSAVDTVRAGCDIGLVGSEDCEQLTAAARLRRDPAYLPDSAVQRELEGDLARLALGTGLRRHAGRARVDFGPDGRLVERSGVDLRRVGVLIGSGGVLRHHTPGAGRRLLRSACGPDTRGGWLLPEEPRVTIDHDCVLAAAGLLAGEHADAALSLLSPLAEGGR